VRCVASPGVARRPVPRPDLFEAVELVQLAVDGHVGNEVEEVLVSGASTLILHDWLRALRDGGIQTGGLTLKLIISSAGIQG